MRALRLLLLLLPFAGCSSNFNLCGDYDTAFDGNKDNCGATESNADGDMCDDVIATEDNPFTVCDCDDNDASTYPGAPTYCDGDIWADRNCDGVPDGDACDDDGDGFTDDDGDCNDGDGDSFPQETETCGDYAGLDNDCDGLVDADDPDCDPADTGAADTGGDTG